jgi:hypothetical protein
LAVASFSRRDSFTVNLLAVGRNSTPAILGTLVDVWNRLAESGTAMARPVSSPCRETVRDLTTPNVRSVCPPRSLRIRGEIRATPAFLGASRQNTERSANPNDLLSESESGQPLHALENQLKGSIGKLEALQQSARIPKARPVATYRRGLSYRFAPDRRKALAHSRRN